MKKVILCIVAILLTVSSYGELKYVFYMIGDGMGANQVLAAEMYQAELQGRIGRVPLTMTTFPVFGMAFAVLRIPFSPSKSESSFSVSLRKCIINIGILVPTTLCQFIFLRLL